MALPRLRVEGRNIVRIDNGQPVLLRGANFLRYEWDGHTRHEQLLIPKMRNEWGGNVAMVGFSSDKVLSGGNHPFGGSYLALLDQIVDAADQAGVYVVLAFRSYGINGPQPTGVPDRRAVDALRKLGRRYRQRPHVMFAAQVETNGNVSWAQAKIYYTACVDAVNEAGAPRTIVMTSGLDWGRDISGAVGSPIIGTTPSNVRRDRLTVYKTHPYSPSSQFQAQFGRAWDAGRCVFAGEFGPTEWMSMSDVNALLWYCKERGIGWTAWAFDYQGGPALIRDNTTATPTSPYGDTVRASLSV